MITFDDPPPQASGLPRLADAISIAPPAGYRRVGLAHPSDRRRLR